MQSGNEVDKTVRRWHFNTKYREFDRVARTSGHNVGIPFRIEGDREGEWPALTVPRIEMLDSSIVGSTAVPQ